MENEIINENEILSEKEIELLTEKARQGDALACKRLWEYYRDEESFLRDRSLAVAFGLFYVAFLGNELEDASFYQKFTDDVVKLSDEEAEKVYNWTKKAEVKDSKQKYADLVYTRAAADELVEDAINETINAEHRNLKWAVQIFKDAAEVGNIEAKYQLAKLWFFGIDNENEEKDVQMAKFLIEAVNKGNKKAASLMLNCYLRGKGVEKDKKAALLNILVADNFEVNETVVSYIQEGKMKELFELIKNDTKINDSDRKDILSFMYYYGMGVQKSSDDAIVMFFEANSTPDKMVFSNKVPEMYGTRRDTFQYEMCEQVLLAGIEIERQGGDNKNSEESRKFLLEMAKKYYIVALGECPRAAVYLLRYMLEYEDPDFLPFATMIAQYWKPNCKDSQKAINMAFYMMGLYNEYYYSKPWTRGKFSDFVEKSNLGIDNRWRERYLTNSQNIVRAKSAYGCALMIDDASMRFGLLSAFKE